MCTALTFQTKDFYFGRTLDLDRSYVEEVTVTPRNFPFSFRQGKKLESHYAIIGMAHVEDAYPLYYDGVNEKGLAIAGLNFPDNACYGPAREGKDNIAHFEMIPWILSQCATVRDAWKLLRNIHLTDVPFRHDMPCARLHWLIADQEEAITVEPLASGLKICHNPVGVLTNNPPFEQQLLRLNDYMHLSAKEPENRFSPKLKLKPYSLGMGALGLPGDLSSQSRFVRAAFVKMNSVCGTSEMESVNQFFHILGSVNQPRGCCDLGDGSYEHTMYTSCCNTDKGIYYYTTYGNHQISAVNLQRENLDACILSRYPLIDREQIRNQN